MDVQAVVAAEHYVDGSDELDDLVIDNLAVNAQHESIGTVAGGSCKDLNIRYYRFVSSEGSPLIC